MRAIGAIAVVLFVSQDVVGEWSDTRSAGPFQLRSEFRLGDENGQSLLREMTRLEQEVTTLLNLTPGVTPIEVNLFRSRRSYQNYLRQRIPEGVSRPALYVKGVDMGRVYVYRRWGYEKDVRHECTHAVLHNALPYVALWLDEGLAEYFEVPTSRRASGNGHLGELKRAIFFGWRPNLARLEQLESLQDMDAGDYRESWAWAHFMLHGPTEVRQVLADYLYDVAEGKPAGRLSERLQAKTGNYEDQLVAHLRHWK